MLSAANVAGPLLIDLSGMLPNWPWQWHALIGFLVFAGIVAWAIADKQREIDELKSGRPQIVLGDKTALNHENVPDKSEVKFNLVLYFENTGTKPAYNLSICRGAAPMDRPEQFRLVSETSSANAFHPHSSPLGFNLWVTQKYKEVDGGKKGIPVSDVLVYYRATYSDAVSGGKSYEDEGWYVYHLIRQQLGVQSLANKAALEPYVREVLKRAAITG